MIAVVKYFEVVTPESAEQGDAAERGLEWEGELTFRELVRELQAYFMLSVHPCTEEMAQKFAPWAIKEGDTDFKTGAETNYSLHLDNSRDPRARRYWAKALRAAGLIK